MKYLLLVSLALISLVSFAQTETADTYTLPPSSSKIIGGFFSLQGQENNGGNGSTGGAHLINIGPYFSLQRTEKRDVLLRTNLIWQNSLNSRGVRTNSLSVTAGIDWRHELHAFKKFKVFGSYGPRIGVAGYSDVVEFNLAATGNVSLAYELSPNLRLLTSVISGSIEYARVDNDFSSFSYNIRNTVLSPNFSVEYILPRKT